MHCNGQSEESKSRLTLRTRPNSSPPSQPALTSLGGLANATAVGFVCAENKALALFGPIVPTYRQTSVRTASETRWVTHLAPCALRRGISLSSPSSLLLNHPTCLQPASSSLGLPTLLPLFLPLALSLCLVTPRYRTSPRPTQNRRWDSTPPRIAVVTRTLPRIRTTLDLRTKASLLATPRNNCETRAQSCNLRGQSPNLAPHSTPWR